MARIMTLRWLISGLAMCLSLPSIESADRPLIGVLSQPGGPAPKGFSYIAASYVKQIEASGARAVPIQCSLSKSEIEEKFNAVNGVVIPGGGQKLKPGNQYFDAAQYLVKLSINATSKGDYFPVHGVCLGLEVLSIILSNPFNTSILGNTTSFLKQRPSTRAILNGNKLFIFDAENYPSNITLTSEAPQSRMFQGIDPVLQTAMQNQSILMQNHVNGLDYSGYSTNAGLSEVFKVTSLSKDRNGKLYISSMESEKYPITATQFHPEKNAFEWTQSLDIPHSPEAVEVTHAFGNFIVSEARKNFHKPESSTQENELLISNFPLIFTAAKRSKGVETDFDECYFFPIIDKEGNSTSNVTKIQLG